jgi:hypothetical protein
MSMCLLHATGISSAYKKAHSDDHQHLTLGGAVQAPIRIPVWMFLNTAGHPQAGHGSVKTSASDGSGLYGSGWRAPLPGKR